MKGDLLLIWDFLNLECEKMWHTNISEKIDYFSYLEFTLACLNYSGSDIMHPKHARKIWHIFS